MVSTRSERNSATSVFAQFQGVLFVVKQDETLYPVPISFFCSEAIVFDTDGGTDLIDKFRLTHLTT